MIIKKNYSRKRKSRSIKTTNEFILQADKATDVYNTVYPPKNRAKRIRLSSNKYHRN